MRTYGCSAVLLTLALGACSLTTPGYQVRGGDGTGPLEIVLRYTDPEGMRAFVENIANASSAADLGEQAHALAQSVCDAAARMPPDLGPGITAGVYLMPGRHSLGVVCVFTAPLTEEMLAWYARQIEPKGRWFVYAHNPAKRTVIFRPADGSGTRLRRAPPALPWEQRGGI